MSLHSYALTTLESVKRFIGITDSDIQVPIFNLYNSSSDATAATYQVISSGIRLIVTGGANAHDSTLTFADADKDTMDELVTYINSTLGKGWVAEVVANGGQSSSSLTMIGATGCLLYANIKVLYAPNDLLLEELINSVTDYIERYCGRRFKSTTYTDELIDSDGTEYLYLDHYPISTVTSIYRHYVFATDDLYDSDYYIVYENEGYIYRSLLWPDGKQAVKITYTAGYDFAVDGIPQDLQFICNSLVKIRFNSDDKAGIASERIGNYSVAYTDEEMPKNVKSKLNQWRRLDVV